MIRKFNFTGRRKLVRKSLAISLVADESGRIRTFNAHLQLAGIDAPTDASVYIEAYRASAYKRFSWGTVGTLVPPVDRSLDDLNANMDLRFRVKVVDENGTAGRLLAVADNLKPAALGQDGKKREPLLPLELVALGEQIWRVNFDNFPAGPVFLQVNSNISEMEHIAKRDKAFRSLIFPSALEQILSFCVLVEEFDSEDPETEIQRWLRFVAGFHPVPLPEDKLDRRMWVADAVSAFSTRLRAREEFVQSRGGMGVD